MAHPAARRNVSKSSTTVLWSRRRRHGMAATALAIALVLGVRAVARAHAALLSSEPAAGTQLSASPPRIRLVFSEAVDPKLATIKLVGGDGSSQTLTAERDPSDRRAIFAIPQTLGSGSYHVLWHAVSDDGHPVSGSFVFTVVTPSAPAPVTAPAVPPPAIVDQPPANWGPTAFGAPLIPAVLRGLGVGCAMALAGLLFFIVRMDAGMASRPVRAARWFAIAAPVFLIAHLVTWLINASPTHSLGGTWLPTVLSSSVGRIELWRTGLSLAPLFALWLARRPSIALVLSIPTLVISAAAGHSAAIHPGWAIPVKALHLSALAAWLGGLLWLVVHDRDTPARLAREGAVVSTVALSCVIVVFLSGIGQTALVLHSVRDFYTAYGITVLAKVAGFAVLILFGTWHRFRVLPRVLDRGDSESASAFTSSVRREISVFWLVILLGGFLAYLSPPPPPAAVRAQSALPAPK